ncbi:MAG: DUF89 family protein [Anaerolineae bacterium]|nr:DUF89 family protein [Anaerolineae bacterium]
MKTNLDCYPCFITQAISGARFAGAAPHQQEEIVRQTLRAMLAFDATRSPAELGEHIQRIIRDTLHVADPYREAKQASTEEALALYADLKRRVRAAADPLDVAIRLSIAGNIIDLAAAHDYDLWGTVERVLTQPFAIDHSAAFRQALAQAPELLFLGDNAGETVFDRILIEELDAPVRYVVKGGPVLNDATREDAIAAGLDRVATLIDNGAAAAGSLLPLCSAEFRETFAAAEVIIAKGQGNYETLSGLEDPRIFFLLQAKCATIARDLGVAVRSIILKQGGR